MPRQKLTLSIEAGVVEKARRFSRQNNTSISALVTEFLASLEEEGGTRAPITARLRGVLPSTVSREDYRDYLASKYEE